MSIRSIVLLRPATSSGAPNREKRFGTGSNSGAFSSSSTLPSPNSYGRSGGGKAVELNTLRKIARAEPVADSLARSSANVGDLEEKWKSQELFPLGDVYLDLYGHAVMDAEKSKKTLQLRELSLLEQKTTKAFERVELRRHRKRFTVVRPLLGETAASLERPQTVSLPTRKYRGKRGRLEGGLGTGQETELSASASLGGLGQGIELNTRSPAVLMAPLDIRPGTADNYSDTSDISLPPFDNRATTAGSTFGRVSPLRLHSGLSGPQSSVSKRSLRHAKNVYKSHTVTLGKVSRRMRSKQRKGAKSKKAHKRRGRDRDRERDRSPSRSPSPEAQRTLDSYNWAMKTYGGLPKKVDGSGREGGINPTHMEEIFDSQLALKRATLKIQQDLDSAIKEREILRQTIHLGIEQQRANLPLPFLFARNAREYCLQRGAQNIAKILRRALYSAIAGAFHTWLAKMERERAKDQREKVMELQKREGVHILNKIAKRLQNFGVYKKFARWALATRKLRKAERRRAATTIQKAWRGYCGWTNAVRRRENFMEVRAREAVELTKALFFEFCGKHNIRKNRAARALARLRSRSATIAQNAWRSYVARCEVAIKKKVEFRKIENERKIRRALQRMRKRLVASKFASLALHAYQMRRVKDLCKRSLAGRLLASFLRWLDGTELIKEEREAARKEKERKDEAKVKRSIKKMLNRMLSRTFNMWVAFKDHNIAVKNKIKKALWGKKKYFFEKLDEHRIQSMTKKAKAQRELERQIRRNKRNEKVMLDFLKKVNGRLLWACFNTWDDERRRIVNLKRMVARSMMGAKRLRFDMWIEYIDIVKELARERDLRNQRVLRETLKKMQNKVKNASFNTWYEFAYKSKGLKRMILKRLTKGNRATLYAWADYTADAIRRREEKRRRDERKVKMAVRKLMYRNKGKAFSTWAKFAVQMRNLKKQMKRAFLGRKAYSFEKWDMYRWNCKATRALVRFNKVLDECRVEGGLIGLSPRTTARARDILAKTPPEVEPKEIELLDKVGPKVKEHAALLNRMALRVQCAYRCKQGRFSLMLKKRARAVRLEEEARQRAREDKAIRVLQRIWRGKLGKMHFADLVKRLRKEEMQEAYLYERRAKAERKKWEREMKEMQAREKLESELQAQRMEQMIAARKRKLAWEAEVLKAWEEVPLEDGTDGVYFYNDLTGESSWTAPRGWKPIKVKDEKEDEEEEADRARAAKGKDLTPKPPSPDDWEEIIQDDGTRYYFNKITGESQWNPPKGFVPAPKEDWEKKKEVPAGLCDRCFQKDPSVSTKATRRCLDCNLPLCLSCYQDTHKSARQLAHKVKVLTKKESHPFYCSNREQCGDTLASRICKQCDIMFCGSCYDAAHNVGDMKKHSYMQFIEGSERCVECEAKLAVVMCDQCGDVYCDQCRELTHSKGRLKTHTFDEVNYQEKDDLEENEEHCSECNTKKATRVCDQCGDPYCDSCYDRLHATGKRKAHTWMEYHAAQTEWEEFVDDATGDVTYFNTKTKQSQKEKPPELMWGLEKTEYLKAEEERKKKEAEESELALLRKKYEVLDQKRKADKKARRKAKKNKKNSFLTSLSRTMSGAPADSDSDDSDDDDSDSDDDIDTALLSENEKAERKKKRKRERELKKRKKKAQQVQTNESLMGSALKNPGTALLNPFGFAAKFEKEKRDREERYLRRMMLGKKKDPQVAQEEAEAEYNQGILKQLAEQREIERLAAHEAALKAAKESSEPKKKKKRKKKVY